MLKKIDVQKLEIGMFVRELDRPWLETPFLFQGFLIESSDEIATLREYCRHVMIDVEQSTAGITRSLNKTLFSVSASNRPTAPQRKENAADAFRENYKEIAAVHRDARLGMIKILNDRRLGKMIRTEEVRAVVNRMMDSILKNPNAALWLTKLRAQDELTAGHCINVAILSLAFSRHLGLPLDTMEQIGLGAILHDIGLTNVTNNILGKKDKLTAEEFSIIKQHSVDATTCIEKPDAIPHITMDILRWHHERIDGSGYPDGLEGDAIPLHAKIVGIADMYDAMVSDRAYRMAMLPPDALHELHRTAGRTFGAELVESFISCIGIYPIGCLVQLSTGAIGMISASEQGTRLEPLVLVVRDPQGRHLRPFQLVDLSLIRKKSGQTWRIEKILDPRECNIDIAAIAAEEILALATAQPAR